MTKQFSNYSDLLTFTRASLKAMRCALLAMGTELVTNGGFSSDSAPRTLDTNVQQSYDGHVRG